MTTAVTSGPGTNQPTVTLACAYNQAGERTSMTDSLSSQGVTSYTYDAAMRVTSIAQSFNGTVYPQVTLGYNAASLVTSMSRKVGTSSTATEVNTTFSYDNANRMVTIQQSKAVWMGFGYNSTPLATIVYGYDAASRVTTQVDAEGTATFTYDNTNQLTAVGGSRTESYGYDANGNRNTTGYTTGTNNEMTASPGTTYTYDNAGNMISSTNTSTHVTTSYTYDYRNRLTQVTTSGSVVATHTYDALNRRIGFKDSGTQTWTVYDGQNPYADFNGSGTLLTRYLYGPAVDELLARTSSGGTTAWYLTDKLGSVRDIIDSSGGALDHVAYDSFGNIVTETNATNGDRFKFAGMEYDPATGQYYDRARGYNSTMGRFVNLDPIGFAAGDADLCRYVFNAPTGATDPSGMDAMATFAGFFQTIREEAALLPGTFMNLWDGYWETAKNGDQARGLGSWADGFVPFFDFFAYFGCYNPRDPRYRTGQFLGGVSRDALLIALHPSLPVWARSIRLYELGSTTVPPAIFESLATMTAMQKGVALWTKYGWKGLFLGARAIGQFRITILKGMTPAAWIALVGGIHGLDWWVWRWRLGN
jgi:RHS repeat-associated protein